MEEKSENGRCKPPNNRNTVEFTFMLEKTQKGNRCRSDDFKTIWYAYMQERFLRKLNEYLLQEKRRDGRRSRIFGLIPLISASNVCYMVNAGLKNCSQHCLKRTEAGSLSRAVVKLKQATLYEKSLHSTEAPWASLIEQKTEFQLTMLNWSR